MSDIKIAVVPAAGQGKRLRPLTSVIPKEMFPTPAGPIIELIIKELLLSGIETVILVIRHGKEMIRQYINTTEYRKNVVFIYQDERPGNGGAILTAADTIKEQSFLVVWGDEIFLGGDKTRSQQLIESYYRTNSPTIALTRVDTDSLSKCGVVGVETRIEKGLYKVSSLVEKPSIENAPSDLASVGGYIITPGVIKALRNTKASTDGEVYLANALNAYCQNHSLVGRLISSKWNETGSMSGYIKSFIDIEKYESR
jgi:putative UTP--glucose-1-phosphate uridylyltransferase